MNIHSACLRTINATRDGDRGGETEMAEVGAMVMNMGEDALDVEVGDAGSGEPAGKDQGKAPRGDATNGRDTK